MKIKIAALFLLFTVGAIDAHVYLPGNTLYAQRQLRDIPLHDLIQRARQELRVAFKYLHDQEAITTNHHTKEFHRWKKMIKKTFRRINSSYVSEFYALQKFNPQFNEMLNAQDDRGDTASELLATFPLVDREDAEFLGIRYLISNRLYDVIKRVVENEKLGEQQ